MKVYISLIAVFTLLFIADVSTTNHDYINFPIKVAGAALGVEPAEKADDKEAKKVDEVKEEKPKTCIEKIKIQQQLIKDSLEDIRKNLKTKVSS